MESAKQRRTFVAVSFKTANVKIESAYEISYVHYENDKEVGRGCRAFSPVVRKPRKRYADTSFEIVFSDLRTLLTDTAVPVIVWDERSRQILNMLIDKHEISNITHAPRYFRLRDYAIRRIGNHAAQFSYCELARSLQMQVSEWPEPDAEHIAIMMRRIEDKFEFPSGVAKAFCAFCDSIMDDKVITTNEATELKAFVELLTERYPEFVVLKQELEKDLEDGIIQPQESADLMRILAEMRDYYEKFVTDEKEL